jgi:RHS repeat-associated protein
MLARPFLLPRPTLAPLQSPVFETEETEGQTGRFLPYPTNRATHGHGHWQCLGFAYNFSLGASDNGDVTAITNNRDNTPTQNFTYDSLNRLASAQTQSTGVTIPNANCWGLTFGYDPWGNLLSGSATGPSGCGEPTPLSVTATAGAANQVAAYCYDAAGNLVLETICPTGTFTPAFQYDAENHLISTAGVTYTYDGDGKRVMKSSGTIYWYGASSDAFLETDLSANLKYQYFFFNGQRVGRQDGKNSVTWYFADHLGSSRVVWSTAATDNSDFYPFGGERVIASGTANTYKFTGKERDLESGLNNFGARYMSSTIGRFITPDWSTSPAAIPYADLSDPQSLNLYSYVRNNPLNRLDPNGHCFWECLKNWFRWEVWTTDDKVEGALQGRADGQRQWLAREQVSYGGKLLSPNYLKSLSNKQVYDLAIAYGSAVATGNVGVEVHRDGQVYTADVHHLLPPPTEFRKYFDDANLNIEDYTIDLSRDLHIDIHSGTGMGRGGAWNNAWREFFRQNPNASADQILEQMNRMADQFGLRPNDPKNLLEVEGPIE